MKKVFLMLVLSFLFIPGFVYANGAEDELRDCFTDFSTSECTVTQDVTLSSDMYLPYFKRVYFNNGADLYLNGHELTVEGFLFMSDGSKYYGNTLKVRGELTFNGEITIAEDQIINNEDNGVVIFKGVTVNNGIINTNVKIENMFTNNKVNGLIKEVTVQNGGTFTNNKNLTIASLKVYNDPINRNSLINNASITITSNGINILAGKIDNAGTIKYNQEDLENDIYFGFNREYYTGNYPEVTFIKNLDYNKRVYISEIIKKNNTINTKVDNGLLLDYDVDTRLYYYHNLISEDKNEYNMVAAADCWGYYFLELLFTAPQTDVNIVYETLDLKNALIEGQFIKGSTIVNNIHYDNYNNTNGDDFSSNSYRVTPKDDTKPIYFQYKIKGFTTGEEVLVRGAITSNNELSALFEGNGGSYTYPVFETAQHLITKPANPTKSGYEFMGWYTEKELINEFDFDTAINENIILYASWEKLPDNPPTSDNIIIYIVITIISILAVAFITYKKIIRK